jgi:hypothetical protein
MAGSTFGSGHSDFEAKHAFNVVIPASLVGLVFSLRWRTG